MHLSQCEIQRDEPKASEMPRGISHATSELSGSCLLSTAAMAMRKPQFTVRDHCEIWGYLSHSLSHSSINIIYNILRVYKYIWHV